MNEVPGPTMGTRIPGDPHSLMRGFKISEMPTSLLNSREGQEWVDLTEA